MVGQRLDLKLKFSPLEEKKKKLDAFVDAGMNWIMEKNSCCRVD